MLNDQLDRVAADLARQDIVLILLPINPFYYQTIKRNENSSLSLWKSSYEKYYDVWDKLFQDFNMVLAKIAANRKNVYFADTRALMDERGREGLYLDFSHYTEEGNQLVAKFLYAFIKERQLLSTSQSPQFINGINKTAQRTGKK